MRTFLLCLLLVSSDAMANGVYSAMLDAIRDNDLAMIEVWASDPFAMALTMFDPWTPLHEAALNNNVEAAAILLRYGADINAEDGNGWTPLHVAVLHRWSKISDFLVKNKASGFVRDCQGKTPIEYVQPVDILMLAAVAPSLLN